MVAPPRSVTWPRGLAILPAAAVALLSAWAAPAALARDADIEFGGPGAGKGKFARVMDLAFDADNNLYVLDGGPFTHRDRKIEGNFLVQKFDGRGRFLRQLRLYDEKLGEKNDPARLAIDGRGILYVTQPRAGLVQRFSPDGRPLGALDIPHAFAIAVQTVGARQRILVAQQPGRDGRQPIDHLEVIDPAGRVGEPLKLSRRLVRCDDLATDRQGNVYAHADVQQLHKFDPSGRHLLTIGAGTRGRREDGSELWNCVAVDSKGGIYSVACNKLVKFDAALTTVARRGGQFTWYDSWGARTIVAIDRNDRLWAATGGYHDGSGRYHFRPAVLRAAADFFGKAADVGSTLLLGLNVEAKPRLPYHVAYQPGEVTIDFVVREGVRLVRKIDVSWQALDVYKARVAGGTFQMALADGVEARRAVRFTTPRRGWYTVEFQVAARGKRLTGICTHLGVTAKYEGMPVLKAGESKGGWEDPARQGFCGLMLLRTHPRPDNLDKLEALVEQCDRYGVTLLAQFTGRKEAAEPFVRQVVTRFKGRIRYWEIINEPNFSFSPAEYVVLCGRLYRLIRKIDPSAKVLAPAVCGVQLPWYKSFYELGGGKCCDVLSVHDYEGHESADQFHWPRKFADLRKLMAAHGDAAKPIWQTERGIPGVRAGCFLGPTQAVRVLLHRNLLASLGVPSDHNMYYYLNQGGYGAYPAYLWSQTGPHPGALALRTRRAMVRRRRYAGRLDFGPAGNKAVLALRYAGKDGSTVVLQNFGTLPLPIELRITAGGAPKLIDAFGNEQPAPVRGGRLRASVGVLPVYLRLAPGQEAVPRKLDFGRNVAAMASFSYSGRTKRDEASVLANGLFESPHAGYPSQYGYFEGEIEKFPQFLGITFRYPRTVDRMAVYSLRADNMQTALLDYDVQAHDGAGWKTVHEVRTPLPASTPVVSRHCRANTWYMDENFHFCRFGPVTASRFRLAVRNTTRGLLPDAAAERFTGKQFGPRLHLREIEIYGPPSEVQVALRTGRPTRRAAFAKEEVTVTATSRARAVRATAIVTPPPGWTAAPKQLPLSVAPGAAARASFTLSAPKEVPVGAAPVDVELRSPGGKLLDYDRLTLRFVSPVQITPRTPARIDAAAQPMPVEIKNVSDAPLRGELRLAVTGVEAGAGRFGPVAKAFGPVAPGASVTVELLVPKLPLLGRAWRMEYAVAARGLVARLEQRLAPVRLWHVLGPFDNDEKNSAFDAVLPPERGVDLSGTCEVHGGAKAKWRLAATDARGYLELAKTWRKRTFACAYAVAYVHCGSQREGFVSVGWDDGVKLWLNGKLVHEHESLSHGAQPDQARKPVRLRKGWNEVLLKVTQGHGGWGFYFDVLTADGRPMKDVAIRPRPGR